MHEIIGHALSVFFGLFACVQMAIDGIKGAFALV